MKPHQPSTGKLSYNGKSWLTVVLEVGHDEIGDADEVEYGLAEDELRCSTLWACLPQGPRRLCPCTIR